MHAWLTERLGQLSGRSSLAQAIRYALNHWKGLIRFLDDGRFELDTNIVERAMRPVALGRKNALFAGADSGGKHWAIVATLIQTALCRARHRAVYAARRTMPNGLVFSQVRHDRPMIRSA
jgi:transposase